jgi:hypothetical protein
MLIKNVNFIDQFLKNFLCKHKNSISKDILYNFAPGANPKNIFGVSSLTLFVS